MEGIINKMFDYEIETAETDKHDFFYSNTNGNSVQVDGFILPAVLRA